MDIVDIDEGYVDTYCKCLEDWSDEMNEAGALKAEWYRRNKERGLRVKLARNEKNEIVGMIHYIPSEFAPIKARNSWYVYCVWVHGYKEGVGNYQKRGIGRQLLSAAEKDAREKGAESMTAWGITLPFFMRSKWFKKSGYERADKDGITELVWKPFVENAEPPKLLKTMKKPEKGKDRVRVTCLRNGWCPGQNLACERMKRAAAEEGARVEYVEIDTDDRSNLEAWGQADAIFINDRQINTGPPPSYEKLRKLLAKSVKKYKSA